MKTSKIEIGAKVKGFNGIGTITRIITKSTGYVEVTYSNCVKKEMSFNLTDENGESMKAKPAKKKELTNEQIAKNKANSAEWRKEITRCIIAENKI